MSEPASPAPGRADIWIEKYRPNRLADIHGHGDIISRLQSYVDRDDLPNLLFGGPAGTGKCVTGETPVLTNQGVMPIADVVGDVDGFAEAADDLEILTLSKTGRFSYVSPDLVYSRNADALRTVLTRDGGPTTVTPEHQFLVLDGDGFQWIPAADLDAGDRLVRPASIPVSETPPATSLLHGDVETRTAFLEELFAEVGERTETGGVVFRHHEATRITQLAYLLATFGIHCQRSTSTGVRDDHDHSHILEIVDPGHVDQFYATIGMSGSRDESTAPIATESLPRIDTIPHQRAVDRLCSSLELSEQYACTESSRSPERTSYLSWVEQLVGGIRNRLDPTTSLLNRTDSGPPIVAQSVPHSSPNQCSAGAESQVVQQPSHATASNERIGHEIRLDLRHLELLTRSELCFDEVLSVADQAGPQRVYDLAVTGTRNYVAGSVPTVMHNTTAAQAIARELYGADWQENFLELNASDDRGIDVVRGRIKDFARASFGGHDYRLIFLDEADSLCVPPGTDVVTGHPSAPVVKRIEEVAEAGEPMPSVDFETNAIQSDMGTLVDSGVADFFEIEITDGRSIVASLSHPFFVLGDDGELIERDVKNLQPGDEIADFKDDIGVSRCVTCGEWCTGRSCSNAWQHEWCPPDTRALDFTVAHDVVGDGGRCAVATTAIRRISYSHRGKAYNISMERTPNFLLGNGILTHNTSDAQAALRRTMEQFSGNTRFILSCNYSSQIIDPIQSRCAVFRFSGIDDEAVATRVREIADLEDIELTDDGVAAIVYAADGDMRKAINALQAAAVLGETVDEETVYMLTSTARPEVIKQMVQSAVDGDFSAARAILDELLDDAGLAGTDVIDQLHRTVWDVGLSDQDAVDLLERIGEADFRIAEGANERIQLEALLASIANRAGR